MTSRTVLRAAARDAGDRFYNSERPCKRGHTTRRYVSSGDCVDCAVSKQRMPAVKAYKARHHRQRSYGLSDADYIARLLAQENRCAICHTELTHGRAGSQRACIDHDHNTGAVRDLLCSACNRGLGLFRDNQSSLVSALAYLQHHEVPQ